MKTMVRAATDVGRVRKANEDSYAWWAVPESNGEQGVLAIVADGMGGAQAGETASRIAVETVLESFRAASRDDPLADLRNAVARANTCVHTSSQSRPELNGMGTTCTALFTRGRDIFIAHVGDSRAYLLRSGGIFRLTQDHSLVAEMVRDGRLTEVEARNHPRRNIVTRAAGVAADVEVDSGYFERLLGAGDAILLCSDGLHGVLDEPEIEAVVAEGRETACERLIALANDRGGPDNITVLLLWIEEDASGA
jgi:PPM family protein phosphatase